MALALFSGSAEAAPRPDGPSPLFVSIPERMTAQMMREQIIHTAYSQLGQTYKRGGSSPGSGFDCSGFTSWVFAMTGVKIPRTSREQFGKGINISQEDLRPGDMVFFRSGRNISHVGIYVEKGYFIHSPNKNSEITISNLKSSGWLRTYAGARRLIPD
ncbi:MAG: C40 family peptidase [Desulfarculales bacterium]|nr:C40 family peptidase [Desulfarculales bacterium]